MPDRDEDPADRQQRGRHELVERLGDARRHPGGGGGVRAGHDVDQLGHALLGAEPRRDAVEEHADVALLQPADGAIDAGLRVDLRDEAQAVEADDVAHALGVGLDAELLDELDEQQREAVLVEPRGQGGVLRRRGDERRGDAGEHDPIDAEGRVHPLELAAQELRARHLGDAGDDRQPTALQLLDQRVVVADRQLLELVGAADEVELVAGDRHRLDVLARERGPDAVEDPGVAVRDRQERAVPQRDGRRVVGQQEQRLHLGRGEHDQAAVVGQLLEGQHLERHRAEAGIGQLAVDDFGVEPGLDQRRELLVGHRVLEGGVGLLDGGAGQEGGRHRQEPERDGDPRPDRPPPEAVHRPTFNRRRDAACASRSR